MAGTTLRDVARLAGVSVGTASNVLSRKVGVGDALRARVLDAAAAVDYAPNRLAAGLRRGATRSVGLCLPNLGNPFFSELAQALNLAMDAAGYDLVLTETSEDAGIEKARIASLLAGRVDGVFVVPTAGWDGIAGGRQPVIVLDRIRRDEPLPSVALDNRAAAAMAFGHLHAAGHREIWMVANPGQFWNAALRVAGFEEAAARSGVAGRVRVIDVGMEPLAIADRLARALSGGRPTAIISANGLATLGTLRALQGVGLRCPADVSLTAIDDAAWMDVLRPAIDVVRQPVAAIAAAARDTMLSMLQGGDGARDVVLAPDLIPRESVQAPVRMARAGA